MTMRLLTEPLIYTFYQPDIWTTLTLLKNHVTDYSLFNSQHYSTIGIVLETVKITNFAQVTYAQNESFTDISNWAAVPVQL